MAARRTALIVTYTLATPAAAVGVFFRALRLSHELQRRGWGCVICNHGPIPSDPKVDQARQLATIVRFEGIDSESDFRRGLALFRGVRPRVVIFGEYPIPHVEPLYLACQALGTPPLLMLEQYYNAGSAPLPRGVDHMILYGLRSMWPDEPLVHPYLRVVPPFIDRVTPKDELPVPVHLAAKPWVTVLGFDDRVLRAGIEILARLRSEGTLGIVLSHAPETSNRMLAEAGVPPEGRLALPLQQDENLFGFIAASRAVVLANGFMQMAEALALGCPAVCIHRGIGMDGYQLDPAFEPMTTFADDAETRTARVLEWLRETPFTPQQRATLAQERRGVTAAVDAIEQMAANPRLVPRLQRYGAEWRRRWRTGVVPVRKTSSDGTA
jgi:hypothetical protein